MIIAPKVRGFICTTAHPQGCAAHIAEQVAYVQKQPLLANGPKRVLIIGASTGYGLATRIVSAFSCQATTIGVAFEKPADDKRTASAGWYNTAAFETQAAQRGLIAKTIIGDAFSNECKQQTIELIRQTCQQVDLVIYSLASPRRVEPTTGTVYNSVLKPIGQSFTGKTVNTMTGEVSLVTLPAAEAEEIDATTRVMGGDDWALWLNALSQANVLAPGILTLAYSYIGPEITYPIYREGTIGRAKEHLEKTAHALTHALNHLAGRALVSVNKAVVTQSSAAIPVVPLYISLLFKIMKERGLHEDCIEQMYRLMTLITDDQQLTAALDERGLLRLDDKEMLPTVQAEVARLWNEVNTENLSQISDIQGYRDAFYRLFGFNLSGVDETQDVNPELAIPSLAEKSHS